MRSWLGGSAIGLLLGSIAAVAGAQDKPASACVIDSARAVRMLPVSVSLAIPTSPALDSAGSARAHAYLVDVANQFQPPSGGIQISVYPVVLACWFSPITSRTRSILRRRRSGARRLGSTFAMSHVAQPFARAAVMAIAASRFHPAKVGACPVPSRVHHRITFTVN